MASTSARIEKDGVGFGDVFEVREFLLVLPSLYSPSSMSSATLPKGQYVFKSSQRWQHWPPVLLSQVWCGSGEGLLSLSFGMLFLIRHILQTHSKEIRITQRKTFHSAYSIHATHELVRMTWLIDWRSKTHNGLPVHR
jgi:hypothetical protein